MAAAISHVALRDIEHSDLIGCCSWRLAGKSFRAVRENVETSRPKSQRQDISKAHQVAEWLLYKWPTEIDTTKPPAPRNASLEVLEGPARVCSRSQGISRGRRGGRHRRLRPSR
jgi:hypothetical protein